MVKPSNLYLQQEAIEKNSNNLNEKCSDRFMLNDERGLEGKVFPFIPEFNPRNESEEEADEGQKIREIGLSVKVLARRYL